MTRRAAGDVKEMHSRTGKARWLAGLVSALMAALLLAGSATAVHDAGVFQLEGDLAGPAIPPPYDWANLFDGSGAPTIPVPSGALQEAAFVSDLAAPDATSFKPGSLDGDVSWQCKRATNPTDKNNILNAYGAAFIPVDAGSNAYADTVVTLGLERFASDGAAHVGWWLLQNPLTCSSPDGAVPFSGSKTPGDLHVRANFTNGGQILSLQLYRWNGSGLDFVANGVTCDTAPGDDLCGRANGGTLTTPWPTQDKTAPPNTLLRSEFVEVGLNLTDLAAGGSPAATPCFEQLLGETRASPDPDATNKDYALKAFDTCRPDVVVSKEASAETVDADDTVTFTLTVQNLGSEDAQDTEVVDTLPDGLVPDSATPTQGSCAIASQTVTCDLGAVTKSPPPGNTETIEIEATATPTTEEECGPLENSASVSASNEEPAQQGNNDAEPVTVDIDCPDVAVAASPADAAPPAGSPASFDIVVANDGPGTALGVDLSDQLSPGSWTLSGADASACTLAAGNTLLCSFGDLSEGESRSFTVSYLTAPDDCGLIEVSPTVSAPNEDKSDVPNNTGSASADVDCPDIGVSNFVSDSTVGPGDTVTFTLITSNFGPGTAADVELDFTGAFIGAGDTIGGADAGDCSIVPVTPAIDKLECDFGDVAEGGVRTVTLSHTFSGPSCSFGVFGNASVSASNEDAGELANNADSEEVMVDCPDIGVSNFVSDSTVGPGDTVTFTLITSNFGPGTAADVELDFTGAFIGAGDTIGGADAGDCSIVPVTPAIDKLECDFGDVAEGGVRTVTLSHTFSGPSCSFGVFGNASVSASNEDAGELANNADSEEVMVDCP